MVTYYSPEEIKTHKAEILAAGIERPNFWLRNSMVQERAEALLPQEGRIVDVGAGSGTLTRDLAARGFRHIEMVDIDDYLPQELKRRFPLHLLDVCNEPLPLRDGSVDAVMAVAIVEHLENPARFVREAHRVLKDEGLLFMSIPWIHSLRSKWRFFRSGNLVGYERGNNHITFFTHETFEKIFSGFTIMEQHVGDPYLGIGNRKIRFPRGAGMATRLFSNKAFYVLQKKG